MHGIDFGRPVPLFPLPNVVVFPAVVQPLHIFEERYRRMMAATLADQGALAMALLKPGWEKDYYGRPAIHEVVCAGKILAHEQLSDGKYNLLLQGLSRARVTGERRQDGYRLGLLEPLAELPGDPERGRVCRAAIAELFTHGVLGHLAMAGTIRELCTKDTTLGVVVDVVAFTCVQEMPIKQRLLEELDPVRRGETLLDVLVEISRRAAHAVPSSGTKGGETPWPPPVNTN